MRLKKQELALPEEAPFELGLVSDDFVSSVFTAFDDLATELGLQVAVATDHHERHAIVEWRAGARRLRVTDDRRDGIIEIFVVRVATDADRAHARHLVHKGELWLPLWAIVKASGGDLGSALRGSMRMLSLASAADAVRDYASPFLLFDQAPADGVAALISGNRA